VPQPSPYAPPGTTTPPPALTPAGVATAAAPASRADGRPALAIHNFSYYFLAFLAATFLGAGILALGTGIGVFLGLILVVCFVVSFSFPSLMWVAFVHHRRRGEPEPRQGVLTALAGGMLATVLPLFINSFVGALNGDAASVLSAPLVEELSKAIVLIVVLKEVNSRYDGLIYGVTAGMGFAMMENLTYSLGALASGSGWGMITLIRGLASTVGHGVTAGLIGYAVGAYIDPDRRTGFGTVALAYLGAVGLHGGWNGLLVVATGLIGGAGVVAMACIIGIWPFMEIGLLVWLMDMGRARGDGYEGGGIYHQGMTAPATGPLHGPPAPTASAPATAAPAPQAWYGPPMAAPPQAWPPVRPPSPPTH
jgi:RsiW-degrading membrane proteinase PrsW (M82 family)